MPATVLARDVFLPADQPGAAIHAASYYPSADPARLISVHGYLSRSDTVDVAYLRHSTDNGRTWSACEEWPTRFDDPRGTGRRHHRGFYHDPASGRCLAFWTEGVLPNDQPLEGMRNWTLRYAVSTDGGRSFPINEQIIHQGPGYDAIHHLPGITVGHNCAMMGDLGERPFTRRDGVIVLPVQVSPVGPDGFYHNPGGGYTYTDCLMLFGRWQADGRLAWTAGERIVGDPKRTTRGVIEPTIAELADGRMLCVMRGSNGAPPDLPGYRWHSFSGDGGQTWTKPEPWTWTDGTRFFSPSSCSQLIPWKDGRLLWLGNVCDRNPTGNSPRYPLILGDVDPATGLLIRDSVSIVDDKAPGESPRLTLSNFYAREDRATGHLLLHITRLFAHVPPDAKIDWTADAMLHRIAVE